MKSLAVKYRPTTFEEVCAQETIIKILNRQLETGQHRNAYLFAGPSGCGKTTVARIFAYKINEYKDSAGNLCSSEPIEIDAASNSGVDNVRNIIENAKTRSLDGKYKVFIIDECHGLSGTAWQAFLKTIEETPKYTIFIFCTTEVNKVPATIKNRCQTFSFSRIPYDMIRDRLEVICKAENYTNYIDTCDYIAKNCNGGMRDAISTLEKVADFSTDLSIENCISVLGNLSLDIMFNLTDCLVDGNEEGVINIVEKIYSEGVNLQQFINQYLSFVLDLNKYIIFNSMLVTKIPAILEDKVRFSTSIENTSVYFNYLADKLLKLTLNFKNNLDTKVLTEVELLNICRLK